MCGIAGVVRWGEKPILEETIAILLVGNEHRGNDASGIVIQQEDGSLDILKKDVPGWQLIASLDYKRFIQEKLVPTSRCVLIHARGASQGNPRDNNNNHPMFAGLSAVVHNGVIRNDEPLFTRWKLERKAETDSDIIRAIFDAKGLTTEAIIDLGQASGSGAIAVVDPRYPGKLALIRSGNPLTLASNEDFFYFSSEKATLHKACRPFVKRMGMWFQAQKPNVDMVTMADNTGWIIGPKGLESHTLCQISNGAYVEPWRKTYEEYGKRQEKWNNQRDGKQLAPKAEREMKPALCKKCHKTWVIPVDGLYINYTCNEDRGGCGSFLSPISTDLKVMSGERRVN